MSDKFNIFGKPHLVLGESSSDMILKTKGKIKIQIGNKYIDLINDGKIQSEFKFIYVVNSIDNIKNKDGIYIVGDEYIYLKSGNSIVNISPKDFNSTYVSFMEKQYTTSDQKYIALQNIGFLYENLSDINESTLQNGVIYVQSEKKLYTISNGELSEFQVEFPDVITKQFIIQKDDSSQGALFIKGSGIDNSIALDSMYIYCDSGQSYIESDDSINYIINNSTILTIKNTKLAVQTPVECNVFQSYMATSTYGFRLYYEEGKSTLEVDNLVVRNGIDSTLPSIYPIYTSYKMNLILRVIKAEDKFYVTLKYQNQYNINDILYTYCEVTNGNYTELVLVTFTVSEIDEELNQIIVDSDDLITYERYLSSLFGKFSFIQNSGDYLTFQYSESNIELIKSTSGNKEPIVKIGDLSSTISGASNGLYCTDSYFSKARYVTSNNIPVQDNSPNFASTEWIHKLFPKGSIIMFSGEESIPDGWAICDGQNGTPNLIDRFIMGSTTVEESTDLDSTTYPITLTKDNLPVPDHTHNIQSSQQEVSVTIPEHTHSLLYVGTSKAKRVETGDGEGAKNYHFAGLGSIYKDGESWNQTTGTDGIAVSSQWDGAKLVSPVQLTGSATIELPTVTDSSQDNKTFSIKYPKYYKLIFIMKII